MDVLTPDQRRKSMQHNRSRDTSIEVVLRKALWHKGYRYRKNYKKLPGKPDIVLTKQKIVVFCDSEFFHGKDWEIKRGKLESSKNADYWIPKIEKNMKRDIEHDQSLANMGWTVIHFWGQDILKNMEECVRVIEEAIFENMIAETDNDVDDE